MDRWSQKIVSCINNWRTNRTVQRSARRIAQDVFAELRECVRRKAGPQNDRAYVASYARSRATHLCYTRVDSLVAVDRNMSGAVAAKIISTSADQAVELVLLDVRTLRRV